MMKKTIWGLSIICVALSIVLLLVFHPPRWCYTGDFPRKMTANDRMHIDNALESAGKHEYNAALAYLDSVPIEHLFLDQIAVNLYIDMLDSVGNNIRTQLWQKSGIASSDTQLWLPYIEKEIWLAEMALTEYPKYPYWKSYYLKKLAYAEFVKGNFPQSIYYYREVLEIDTQSKSANQQLKYIQTLLEKS